jgi:hypothetical protein
VVLVPPSAVELFDRFIAYCVADAWDGAKREESTARFIGRNRENEVVTWLASLNLLSVSLSKT